MLTGVAVPAVTMSLASRRVLVTGGNKGIGAAIVESCLQQGAHVVLAARSLERAKETAAALVAANPSFDGRLDVVALDVTSDESVKAAKDEVQSKYGAACLYGLVNNAGVGVAPAEEIFATNFFGVHRVTNAFLPLLEPGGRVVMISSGSAPMFVAKCSPERQAFFRNPVLTWMQIKEAADLFLAVSSDAAKLAEAGFPAPNQCGLPDAYGASKAFLNSYTMHLARVQSSIKTNACSPGFIVTDLVSKSLADPAKAGALPPSAGAVAPLYLLTSPDVDNGVYYGSDAKRSPLHKYRSPGTPAYTGEDD